jgi:uncharacterized membrane protein
MDPQSPQTQQPVLPTQPAPAAAADPAGNAKVVYILYLVSIAVGVTNIVGVIMAYVYQGQAPDWVRTHYRFQIRTFWIGLLYGFISFLLCFVLVGFLLLLLLVIWLVVRCVKGMQALDARQPYPNPASWLW